MSAPATLAQNGLYEVRLVPCLFAVAPVVGRCCFASESSSYYTRIKASSSTGLLARIFLNLGDCLTELSIHQDIGGQKSSCKLPHPELKDRAASKKESFTKRSARILVAVIRSLFGLRPATWVC